MMRWPFRRRRPVPDVEWPSGGITAITESSPFHGHSPVHDYPSRYVPITPTPPRRKTGVTVTDEMLDWLIAWRDLCRDQGVPFSITLWSEETVSVAGREAGVKRETP